MKNIKPTIDTLVEDIYSLFTETSLEDTKPIDEDLLEKAIKDFQENIGKLLKDRIQNAHKERKAYLRLSKIGVKDRKLWYELKEPLDEKQTLTPATFIKFLYGDLIEELVLFLVKCAGHKVEGEQGEIEVEGIIGHRDCKIDGITVDVKSTSRYAFKKFSQGLLLKDDPFGYIAQISSYAYFDKSPFGGFLAMNKETGELAFLKIDEIDMIDPVLRVKNIKKLLKEDKPPKQKCYSPVPLGKSGNEVLATGCTYCPYKEKCWRSANEGKGLIAYEYSNGLKYFTKLVSEPRVPKYTHTHINI